MVGLALSHPSKNSFSTGASRSSCKTSARAPLSMRAVSEVPMRQSHHECHTDGWNERSDLSDRVVAFLKSAHPQKTAEHVAVELKISVCTVQKWIERHSAPSAWMLLRMVSAYGPEFLAAVMGEGAPGWLRKDAHDARRAEIEAQMSALQQELSTL